jgi:putative DNA primase/helicase
MFVIETNAWHSWDGCRWREVGDEVVHAYAQVWIAGVGKLIAGQAGDVSDLMKRYAAFRQVGKLERVVTSARRRLLVHVAQLDAHPHLLNVLNGVVNLRNSELSPHDPDLLLTKIAGAAYLPGARHIDIDNVLACMDADVAASVQCYLGAAANGPCHRLPRRF